MSRQKSFFSVIEKMKIIVTDLFSQWISNSSKTRKLIYQWFEDQPENPSESNILHLNEEIENQKEWKENRKLKLTLHLMLQTKTQTIFTNIYTKNNISCYFWAWTEIRSYLHRKSYTNSCSNIKYNIWVTIPLHLQFHCNSLFSAFTLYYGNS